MRQISIIYKKEKHWFFTSTKFLWEKTMKFYHKPYFVAFNLSDDQFEEICKKIASKWPPLKREKSWLDKKEGCKCIEYKWFIW